MNPERLRERCRDRNGDNQSDSGRHRPEMLGNVLKEDKQEEIAEAADSEPSCSSPSLLEEPGVISTKWLTAKAARPVLLQLF